VKAAINRIVTLPESRYGFLAVFGFGLLLMGALFIARWKADLNLDGEVFLSAARKFAEGRFQEGLSIYSLPLYPYLITLLHDLIPDWVIAGRLVSYLFMTLLIIPLYFLTRDLFDRQAAFWSCVIYALWPDTLLNSFSVLRDPVFFFCILCSVYSAQKALTSHRLDHVAISAALAWCSTLFRVDGLILIPVFGAVATVMAIKPGGHRSVYGRMLAVWGGLFIILSAGAFWVLEYRSAIGGRFDNWVAISGEFFNLENFQQISSQLQLMQDSARHSVVGLKFAGVAKQLIVPIYLLGILFMLIKVILPIHLITLVFGFRGVRYHVGHIFVLLTAVCFLGMLGAFFIWHDYMLYRHLFTPALLVCPWIGAGITKILDAARRLPRGRLVVAGLVLVVFIFPTSKFNHYFSKPDDLKSRAGLWIAQQSDFQNMRIFFNDAVVAFHTGREINFYRDGPTQLYLEVDDKDFSGIEPVALKKNIDLLVLYTRRRAGNELPRFRQYAEIREFSGNDRVVTIYGLKRLFPDR
jgi:hypothetical protein